MVRVETMWQDETGTLRVAPGVIEDRSRGGVSVRVKEPVSIGSNLEIKSQNEQFTGVVKNCRRDGRGYVLGIQRDTI